MDRFKLSLSACPFGELANFTIDSLACQALFASISNFLSKPATRISSPKSLVWKRRRFDLAVFPGNCKLATSRMSLPIHQRYRDELSVSAPKSASLGELDEITIESFACQHHSASFENFLREQFGLQGSCAMRRRSCVGKCRRDEPGSIFLGP